MVQNVAPLNNTFKNKCSRNAYIEMDLWPYKEDLIKNDNIYDKIEVASIKKKLSNIVYNILDISNKSLWASIYSEILRRPKI
jgi:Na+-transporting NADH:ubiquinone oxidoreductase subunit NqrC